jgi:hypothetical protein
MPGRAIHGRQHIIRRFPAEGGKFLRSEKRYYRPATIPLFLDEFGIVIGKIINESIDRQRPLCGLTIIWGLQPKGPGHWSSGWLYDPQDGVTYDLTAELTAPDTIYARVYRGIPVFGRTEILMRNPQLSFDGRC